MAPKTADAEPLMAPPHGSGVFPWEFTWSPSPEPHKIRRKKILEAHPEVKQLFGPEPLTLPITVALVVGQVLSAAYFSQLSGVWFVLAAWAFNGTISHALFLAGHEISHNLAFETPVLNTWLGIFSSCGTGFPSFTLFKRYHMEHHREQGVDGVDTDVPTYGEAAFFGHNPVMKTLAVILNPALYAIRPMFIKPITWSFWEYVNLACQIAFDYVVYSMFGGWTLGYIYLATLLGLGLHPTAGHFIAEHYLLDHHESDETFSYYGPLNWVAWNVGLHREHHDLVRVPWSRLGKVKEMAPEFYGDRAVCHSWPGAIWAYITDSSIGPNSRMKRAGPATAKRCDEVKAKAQ